MSKYGSPSVSITLDNAGGTPVVLSNFVLEMGGVKITANTEPSTAFGDSWEENLPTAIRKVEELTLTGFLDDVASGPHETMKDPDSDPNGTTRTLAVDFGGGGGTNTILTVECLLTAYEVTGAVNALTRFTATLLPTGSAAWS
jgi:hypothetical protein